MVVRASHPLLPEPRSGVMVQWQLMLNQSATARVRPFQRQLELSWHRLLPDRRLKVALPNLPASSRGCHR